jgi:DNA invertase Pin-like site-specific DNA recombinase
MKANTCAIYTRTAAANASRIEDQRRSAEAYIAERGLTASSERYDDDGHSGNTTDRPGLRRLMEDAAAGKVGCVVVHDYPRLARDVAVLADVVDFFQSRGVDLVSATQPSWALEMVVALAKKEGAA